MRSTSCVPERPERLFSMEMSLQWLGKLPIVLSGFLRDQTSSTASRMAEVPLKPPCLLAWWMITIVVAGNDTPLLRVSQYKGVAKSDLFSSKARPPEQPISESMTTSLGLTSCIRSLNWA